MLEPLKIGTGSVRRQKQLKLASQSPVELAELRGKIETRLAKIQSQGLDGIVLAAAGLERMGYLADLDYEVLPTERFVPAVGQGIMGVECPTSDDAVFQLLREISDPETEQAALAERHFLTLMNGNCDIPLGGFASRDQASGDWTFQAFLAKSEEDPGRHVEISGPDPYALSQQAFEALQ